MTAETLATSMLVIMCFVIFIYIVANSISVQVERIEAPKRLKIYLAGPMAGCDDEQATSWRDEATRELSAKYDIFNPMVRDFREGYDPEKHEALIVEGDKNDIDNSDIVLVNIWKNSTGTTMEIIYAWENGKEVIMIAPNRPRNGNLSPWHSYHANVIFNDVQGAIAYLNARNLCS